MLLKRVESIHIQVEAPPRRWFSFQKWEERERGDDTADEKFKTWGFNPIGGVPLNSHMKTKASCCCSRSSSCSYISILLTQCYKIWINKKLGELFELHWSWEEMVTGFKYSRSNLGPKVLNSNSKNHSRTSSLFKNFKLK